jgi:hypothetical protein
MLAAGLVLAGVLTMVPSADAVAARTSGCGGSFSTVATKPLTLANGHSVGSIAIKKGTGSLQAYCGQVSLKSAYRTKNYGVSLFLLTYTDSGQLYDTDYATLAKPPPTVCVLTSDVSAGTAISLRVVLYDKHNKAIAKTLAKTRTSARSQARAASVDCKSS